MFTISNDELEDKPMLKATVICKRCGKEHPVEYGKRKLDDGTWITDTILAFTKCDDKVFLVGVDGKEI
jgi:hypothetical protein